MKSSTYAFSFLILIIGIKSPHFWGNLLAAFHAATFGWRFHRQPLQGFPRKMIKKTTSLCFYRSIVNAEGFTMSKQASAPRGAV